MQRRGSADVSQREDLLSLFMTRHTADGTAFVGCAPAPAPVLTDVQTDEELRDMMMSFILAGRDTTAVLIAWTLHELSCHGDVLTRVVDEIDAVLGGREPTYDDVHGNMPYLHVWCDVCSWGADCGPGCCEGGTAPAPSPAMCLRECHLLTCHNITGCSSSNRRRRAARRHTRARGRHDHLLTRHDVAIGGVVAQCLRVQSGPLAAERARAVAVQIHCIQRRFVVHCAVMLSYNGCRSAYVSRADSGLSRD